MEKQPQKNSKEYENLKRNLSSLLKDFERNREWADIGNWLYRLQQLLGDKKYRQLPCETNLAKRLAQCLNPTLPAGIHSTALKIYSLVLKNFQDRINILPLMSIGLFPFFQYSSSQLKLELVKIFDEFFICDHESLQMIVSLMNALLTGLNEKNEQLAKKIYGLCDKMSRISGRIWVDGAVWVNILRSPKVRIAGFKYFMKVFKDRDRGKGVSEQKQRKLSDYTQLKNETDFTQQEHSSTSSVTKENQQQMVLLEELKKLRQLPDTAKTRFPNFSSLVVNALLVCLQENEPLVKRSALDLMVTYLKLANTELISKKDAVILVSAALQILPLKEYSLTRRVYTYLFDQPNMEGIYQIQEQQRGYEIQIMRQAILQKLTVSQLQPQKNPENNLTIIETLIMDHPKLAQLLLPHISYAAIVFVQRGTKSRQWLKKLSDFHLNIIQPYKKIFVQSVVHKLKEENDRDALAQIVTSINFYFDKIEKFDKKQRQQSPSVASSQKQQQKKEHKQKQQKQQKQEESSDNKTEDKSYNYEQSLVMLIIENILIYIKESECMHQKICVDMIELCNRLYLDLKERSKLVKFTPEQVKIMDELIESKPVNSIYGGLLALHPQPKKSYLLPYIDQGPLAIVSLSNLLMLEHDPSEQELKVIFFAIFKLLNCHLWEDRGVEFIRMFIKKYPQLYDKYINEVEPSEWLIYWKKMNGDVRDGVINMLLNLDNKSPLLRNLSEKWVQSSSQIISKIVDPVYRYMNEKGIQETATVYSMLQNIFKIQNQDFTKFFFLQRDKYLFPLINHIFTCLDQSDETRKSMSIEMMKFLLSQAHSIEQKFSFISLTLNKILITLQKQIKAKNFLMEIQLMSYMRSLLRVLPDFSKHAEKREILYKLLETSDIFLIVVTGMYESQVPYLRTLYIEYLHQACTILSSIDNRDRLLTGSFINIVFEKLFIMLRQNEVTTLEQIIQGKQVGITRRKKSESVMVFDQLKVDKNDINIENKYAQAIELWNSIKFYTSHSIKSEIKELPIVNLISIILQSFPFSDLKYAQFSPEETTKDYQVLQQEVKNVTGLKKEVLQIFEILWQKYECQIIDFLIEKGDPKILVHANLDPNMVIKAINRSNMLKVIRNYKNNTKLSLPKGTLHYNVEILMRQNQLNYFLYLYLVYCNMALIKNRKIGSFLSSVLNLLKTIEGSSHIQTKLWLLQIVYLLSERIPLKEVHAQNGKLKSQMQDFLRVLLEELVVISIRGRNFTHRSEIKTGLMSLFSKEEKESSLFDFVKIFPPTLFTLGEKNGKAWLQHNSVISIESYTQHFLFSQWLNRVEEDYINYLSIVSIKTLIAISIDTLINLYQSDTHKIALIIKENLIQLLPLCENKSEENQVYLELIAEYLHRVLDNAPLRQEIMKTVRRNIIDIYMGNDFFKCTKKTLYHWKAIIDYCTQAQDLLGQLLSKEGLFEGIFIRKSEAMRLKIKSFERVCFVIYAGKLDKYENKLWTVLESLNEVMKDQDPSPALLILILFCIRILFLRLSQTSLSRMFRSIWPSLMTLLVKIFRKQKAKRNVNLLLNGLKVIELVHALELEEFHLHQWMFIFDYFGIRLEPVDSEHEKLSILTPFEFKPYMTSLLPIHEFKCNFVPEPSTIEASSEPVRRKLIVKESSIESEEQLRNHAYILMQYIIDLNQRRVTVSKDEIEDLIEGDFISLDDYIFQLK